MPPRVDSTGRKVFELRLQQGTTELLPGKPTETWGVNVAYLGPTLRAAHGDRVAMHVINNLPEPTTIHWHGMHLPAAADGGPHQPIEPGATWAPSWTVDQPAATLWYHPHPHGVTDHHAYRGLTGLFLIDDQQASGLPLPNRYGIDDIPVVVQDKRIDDKGNLDLGEQPFAIAGRLGSQVLVNGTYDPHLTVTTQRVRLRLLNASTARTYNFGLAGDRAFDMIATDGGLLERTHRTTRIPLSPGERAEVVVTFQPGERVVLRSFPPDLGANFFEGRFAGADDTFDLLQIRAAAHLAASPEVPDHLVDHQRLDQTDAAVTRRFDLDHSAAINSLPMDLGRIDHTVTVDTTEIWKVRNASSNPHNFHVHGAQFKLATHAGSAPPPHLAEWKDTAYIPPDATTDLLLRFTRHTDPAVAYMFHCHLLRHEDNGMMGQFVVVNPGQQASKPPSHHHR